MKQLNQEEAKRISDRVLKFSKADECSVSIEGKREGNVRFARNSISTAGLNEDMHLDGARRLRQEGRHRALERVRRQVAGKGGAPRRRTGAPGAGKPGIHAGRRQAGIQGHADLCARHRRHRSRIPRPGRGLQHRSGEEGRAGRGRLLQRRQALRGDRQFERRVRLPGDDRPGLHLHRAHRRRARFGLGHALGERREPLRRARSGRRGDRKGAALGRGESAGAGPLHGDPGAGRHLRGAGQYVQRVRCARCRRGPQFPHQGRRQEPPGRQAVRREDQRLGRPLESGRAGRALGWPDHAGAPAHRHHQERPHRLARLFALLGAEEGRARPPRATAT